jgi:hypothetical protein
MWPNFITLLRFGSRIRYKLGTVYFRLTLRVKSLYRECRLNETSGLYKSFGSAEMEEKMGSYPKFK